MLEEKLARALNAEARRKIIHILSSELKLNVQDIANIINISKSAASKHLKILYDFGLLRYEKNAREKFYSLSMESLKDLDHIFRDIAEKMKWKKMDSENYSFTNNKVILKIKGTICEQTTELVSSPLFKEIVKRSISELKKRGSYLLKMFGTEKIDDNSINLLIDLFEYLLFLPIDKCVKLLPEAKCFEKNKNDLFNYIEFLYNYWRSYERFIISVGTSQNRLDKKPYRTFNSTIEVLTHLVRKTYRDIQENITSEHPNVYRQVRAGAGFATIAIPMNIPLPLRYSEKTINVNVMRQILINPPIVLEPTMNKRSGIFQKVDENPIDKISIISQNWICFPAKVGDLIILVYIHETFYELGFSLANLFEIATAEDLKRKPDGIYYFGVQDGVLDNLAKNPTVFYDDEENNLLVGAVPGRDEFGYFGYLKKMILTLHNIIKMKNNRMPYHGSMTRVLMGGGIDMTVLIIGDSGAGKSETLEAFRKIGEDQISDIIIIADDMGSLDIKNNGEILGYGTEIGAFLRLDDLSPSSTFGAIDRAIFMNVSQINSRVIIPITSLHHVNAGTKVDLVLYANNYEEIDDSHPIIEKCENIEDTLKIFREGSAMSKGTTTSTGLQHNYFVNPFGVPSYKDLHDSLAIKYFTEMMKNGVYFGQIRTQLGIKGMESKGPLNAAENLINLIKILSNK